MTPAPPPPDPASPPAPERVAAALALLDSFDALYNSGNTMGLWYCDGKAVRLRVMAQQAARVVTIAAEKG